ncbi:O-antigen ligase family protein [Paenibacillus sediminis]|uniref:O-antigen ligase/tetratricopeptide (TPR) repeat protein n=1 Tax=Paenibacillus sediminis TaxID=664909 RepID=A0ABS4H253_9BACL|nr:O-antigen ligase family protein [Paenibacillus sediminis]MBP1936609.1 O-antigen ligase/tetratricopeptide (TPR) repeat protein [Paenibacillus sediminis]
MSNPVYGKQTNTSRDVGNRSSLFWLVIIGVVLFLVWAPFQIALFNGQMLDFERPIYWAVFISSVLLLMMVAAFYKKFKLEDQRDALSLFVLLLPLTYIVSLFFAASHNLAVNMVLIQCIYASIFLITLYLLQDKLSNKIMQMTLMGVAYIIVLFGFLNWFGQGTFAAKLVDWFSPAVLNGKYNDAVMTDSNGLRLTSVFQYANTYAAFLMAILFAAVFNVTRLKKWYDQLLHGFMLVPIIVSLLLTLSRGGLVMLPVAFVILLLLLKPAKQILWFIYCAIAGAASLAIISHVTDLGLSLNQKYNGSDAAKGWAYLLIASAIVAILVWLIERFLAPRLDKGLQGLASRKLSNLWIPLGSLVAGALLILLFVGTSLKNILPHNILVRVENINFNQHSVLERFTFYKDATKLLADYPIFGAGGGAWATLYEKYQNNPYTSRQAHNFFLQYLVEVGIVGFIVFMAFMIFIFYKYIRSYLKSDEEQRESHFIYFILTMSILLHSILDFNMSYVFMGILVFIGFGGMASVIEAKPLKKFTLQAPTMRSVYTILLTLASIVLVFVSLRYVSASSSALEARAIISTSNSYEELRKPLDKELKIRSTHPDTVLLMTSLLEQMYKQTQNDAYYKEAYTLLTKALKDEPYNKNLLNQLITMDELKNQQAEAFKVLKEHVNTFKWDINWYESLIAKAYELGSTDAAKKDEYFNTGLTAYNEILKGVAYLKTLPKGQFPGRPFEVTPTIALHAGKMYYMSNKPDQAAAALKLGLNQNLNDATNREIARWYLAALQKQGTNDQNVYDQLIKVDPSEKNQIKQIVSLKL